MESPFSWNCRYLNRSGFPCQITARAEDSKTLLAKIDGIEKWLVEQGATPAQADEAQPVAVKAQASEHEHPEGWCTIHDVQMKRNTSDDGRTWWSHRTDAGWCKGRQNGHK